MSSTSITASDDNHLVEQFAMLSSGEDVVGGDEVLGRRRSRASINFFQRETTKLASTPANPAPAAAGRRRNSFIGLNGKIQDDYIAKRASLNKPSKSLQTTVPLLADLTKAESITRIDGAILSQLLISGYARLNSKVDELNRINVYPIADGDTGANMKVCLKLPARNLILDPSSSILRVASNMAADVLLNGQGNSGTILSHFYVSLAEVIGDDYMSIDSDSLSINEFAQCLSKTGAKMKDAVSNPQEGTIISVSRDSCAQLWNFDKPSNHSNLKELLHTWNAIAQSELQKTPDQLIVNGVKVLEKAGVVDSGAAGFVYCIEGMLLAAEGKLLEAFDPNLFKTGVRNATGDDNDLAMIEDHNVCDSKYQFCTEAVILLKDGVTKKDVIDMIDTECKDIGDSVALVGAPAKEGGDMVKIHIHTNNPQDFFDKLKPYSRDPIYKKEKVEDMKIMRELEHGKEGKTLDLSQAKFTMVGMPIVLSPEKYSEEIFAFPIFVVPEDTGEPIDGRYTTDTEVLIALNQQRNKSTATKYSTATSSPMQMKIELLLAIAKGKPILVSVVSTNKKFSSFGRNVLQAIDMLDPEQKKLINVFVHGISDDILLLEAITCAKEGKDIDETIAICDDVGSRTYQCINFLSSVTRNKLKAWRPAMFPDEIIDGTYKVCGTPGCVRVDGCPADQRIFLSFAEIGMTDSMLNAFEVAVKHIKDGLQSGQKIGNVLIPCVGRPDTGHLLLKMIEEAGIEIIGTPRIYAEGIFAVMSEWGAVTLKYKIVE